MRIVRKGVGMDMARVVERKKYVRNLDQITAWVSPHYELKARLRALRAIDHRLTESRITEDALMAWVPALEQRLRPDLKDHRRKSA